MTAEGTEALARVARLFKIVTLVSVPAANGQRLGRQELAAACGCEVRTVQRDLALLAEAGIPIDYRRRSYRLPDGVWTFPIASLTAEDSLALALLQGLVSAPGLLPQGAALRKTLEKLVGSLPPVLASLMAEAGQVLLPSRPVRDYSVAPLAALLEAARVFETVELDYRSRSGGERSWRRVDPYRMEHRAGQFWELHGWCHRRGAVRTFALDQVLDLRGTGTAFQVREEEWASFSASLGVIGGLRGGALVSVDVVFEPPVATYARDQWWPPGLTVTEQPDGVVGLRGEVLGIDGLIPELLRWRRHCLVRGGLELRTRMAEEVRAMAALYAEDCSATDCSATDCVGLVSGLDSEKESITE